MIAIVMAGGRGSRMRGRPKLLAGGASPVVMRVVGALRGSGCFDGVAAAASPNAPEARRLLLARGVRVIDTPGAGYSADLAAALEAAAAPALVVSGDMPLLDAGAVRALVRAGGRPRGWASFVVTEALLSSLGRRGSFRAPGGGLFYTGVSLVAEGAARARPADERIIVFDDRRIALSVNEPGDLGLVGPA